MQGGDGDGLAASSGSQEALLGENIPGSARPATWDRRGFFLKVCFGLGLGTPLLMWILALGGVRSDAFPTDKVATVGVMLSVYAPALALWDNEGEVRHLREKLFNFGFLWFVANTGYQTCWELPWMLLKNDIMKGVDEDQPWYWPWWAYGSADTRYLAHNDLTLAISAMDGAIALSECIVVYLFFKRYTVAASWVALVLQCCLGWGQAYFYVGEIYNNFSNIHDGWFGLYIKYFMLGFPWLVAPLISAAGFIWKLAFIYRKRAVEQYLEYGEVVSDKTSQGFMHDSDFLLLVDDDNNLATATPQAQAFARRLLWLALLFPVLFLTVDALVYYAINFW